MCSKYVKKEVKLSLQQAMGARRVVRCWGSHTFSTVSSQMAVRLSAYIYIMLVCGYCETFNGSISFINL
jgi:hypothetical protein